MVRFELTTSAAQKPRATNCATSRNNFLLPKTKMTSVTLTLQKCNRIIFNNKNILRLYICEIGLRYDSSAEVVAVVGIEPTPDSL